MAGSPHTSLLGRRIDGAEMEAIMLTIDDLKQLQVRPNPPRGDEEDNNFYRGAEAMRAAIINALRNGNAEQHLEAGED